MEEVTKEVFEIIAKKLYDKASGLGVAGKLAEAIQRDTYENEYFPNKVYYNQTGMPTYEFIKSWTWRDTVVALGTITKELYYDPSNMSFDANTWKHGSPFGGDARANLAEILDVNGYTSSLKAPSGRPFSKKRKAYWTDNFIKSLFDDKELEQMFDEEFSKRGFERG